MKTIKCEVIKDLIPLYVDDVLSTESHELVEEHFTTCAECKTYCEKLKHTYIPILKNDAENEKKVIQSIHKSINKKRIIAIGITAILLMAIFVGLYYALFIKQSYLPYEETGLYVENGRLHTKEPYYCYYCYESLEEGTIFVYMTTTAYESNNNQDKDVTVDELYRECDDNSQIEEESGTKIERIYYIPKDKIQSLTDVHSISKETDKENIYGNQEWLEELKRESVLIWEE